MVNSKFSFYFVYFKAAIYVFLLIPSSSDLGTGKGWGGGVGNTFVSRFLFFNWKFRVSILLMHLSVKLATANEMS